MTTTEEDPALTMIRRYARIAAAAGLFNQASAAFNEGIEAGITGRPVGRARTDAPKRPTPFRPRVVT